MQLKIERQSSPSLVGELVLFEAKDLARRRIRLALRHRDWTALQGACGRDPVAEVEYLALSGRWTSHADRKVWFVERS